MIQLVTLLKGKVDDERINKEKSKCVLCGETWSGFCGTPRIQWAGCCVGFKDEQGTRYATTRIAHVACFLHHLQKEKLITFTEKGDEYIAKPKKKNDNTNTDRPRNRARKLPANSRKKRNKL